jgi:hypothetical protein
MTCLLRGCDQGILLEGWQLEQKTAKWNATVPVAIIARVFGYQSNDILKIFPAIKNPLPKEKICERGEIQIPSLLWRLTTKMKILPERRNFSERGEIRTLNQWLKRPLLCH